MIEEFYFWVYDGYRNVVSVLKNVCICNLVIMVFIIVRNKNSLIVYLLVSGLRKCNFIFFI